MYRYVQACNIILLHPINLCTTFNQSSLRRIVFAQARVNRQDQHKQENKHLNKYDIDTMVYDDVCLGYDWIINESMNGCGWCGYVGCVVGWICVVWLVGTNQCTLFCFVGAVGSATILYGVVWVRLVHA